MATGRSFLRGVMKFARASSIFQTPTSADDPIFPSLASLPDATYSKVWIDLHKFLHGEGLHTGMPINEMRTQVSWGELASFAFDKQLIGPHGPGGANPSSRL